MIGSTNNKSLQAGILKIRDACIVLAWFILLGACNNTAEGNVKPVDSSAARKDSASRFIYHFGDSALDARVRDTLMKMPFVIKSDRYIDSFSRHKHGISFIIDTADNQISVMAGYNGPERFESYYNFTIHPATFAIRVLDPLNGEFITIEEFIKKDKE